MKEIVLGGPNGAGKTTAARVLLPEFLELHEYLNADEIARRISPDDVDSAAFAAGRELIVHMRQLVREGRSFALETTCSGKSFLPTLRECKENAWKIKLLYFWLPTPEASLDRVARRVLQGGHGIPAEAIYRRFRTGLWNMLHLYLPLADEAEIYDNSDRKRVLVAEKREGRAMVVHDWAGWNRMEEIVR
ncbi:MAG: AAA family ATPase [Terracidiphilus sp.]